MHCKFFTEQEVGVSCEKAKEIVMKEINVQDIIEITDTEEAAVLSKNNIRLSNRKKHGVDERGNGNEWSVVDNSEDVDEVGDGKENSHKEVLKEWALSSCPSSSPHQKKRRSDSQNHFSAVVVDKISALPDSILHTILSFLPTRNAVQTCVLAKSWRNIWRSVACIDIDLLKFTSRVSFEKFVESFISLHDDGSDIHKIRYATASCPQKFITFAEAKRVEVLELVTCSCDFTRLNTFSLLRVLILKDWGCYMMLTLPTELLLPHLKTLHLESVNTQYDPNHLFSSSRFPALETLHIETCTFQHTSRSNINFPTLKNLTIKEQRRTMELFITAPNLRSFIYNDNDYISFTDDMVSLSDACLSMQWSGRYRSFCSLFFQLIAACRCSESLSLSNYKGLSRELPEKLYLLNYIRVPFCNLKMLKVATSFHSVQLLMINILIKHSPNLETIILQKDEDPPALGDTKDELSPWIECMLPRLMMVEIKKFQGCKNGIKVVEFLLESAAHLKKLVIEYDDTFPKDKIGKHLLAHPRVSSGTTTTNLSSVSIFFG